ncbi:hypothetical protein MSG28_015548 [Choristoneura fumiferana]|uniref:Uncharacterized protein n=1 Tax=Choristoneura fumiferana TaxID=7141 RepID=A0ACC0KBT2_CHOFU|nr:hypothetical protein MSG28_015548 [Choristoneura fumiferana]
MNLLVVLILVGHGASGSSTVSPRAEKTKTKEITPLNNNTQNEKTKHEQEIIDKRQVNLPSDEIPKPGLHVISEELFERPKRERETDKDFLKNVVREFFSYDQFKQLVLRDRNAKKKGLQFGIQIGYNEKESASATHEKIPVDSVSEELNDGVRSALPKPRKRQKIYQKHYVLGRSKGVPEQADQEKDTSNFHSSKDYDTIKLLKNQKKYEKNNQNIKEGLSNMAMALVNYLKYSKIDENDKNLVYQKYLKNAVCEGEYVDTGLDLIGWISSNKKYIKAKRKSDLNKCEIDCNDENDTNNASKENRHESSSDSSSGEVRMSDSSENERKNKIKYIKSSLTSDDSANIMTKEFESDEDHEDPNKETLDLYIKSRLGKGKDLLKMMADKFEHERFKKVGKLSENFQDKTKLRGIVQSLTEFENNKKNDSNMVVNKDNLQEKHEPSPLDSLPHIEIPSSIEKKDQPVIELTYVFNHPPTMQYKPKFFIKHNITYDQYLKNIKSIYNNDLVSSGNQIQLVRVIKKEGNESQVFYETDITNAAVEAISPVVSSKQTTAFQSKDKLEVTVDSTSKNNTSSMKHDDSKSEEVFFDNAESAEVANIKNTKPHSSSYNREVVFVATLKRRNTTPEKSEHRNICLLFNSKLKLHP